MHKLKRKLKIKKNIGMHSLHRNKQKIPYKIVRKSYIKNIATFFKVYFYDYYFINLKNPCNLLNINF